ncbi:MAG: tetratricopeptide repeat protein [Desulfobacterales bacterium]|nr:tetratricopeptide repeat protein [Desulfobacterales bacterium]
MDAETAFALARGETRLEHLYPFLHPDRDHNPHYALPYFQNAIRLRPNATDYHYAFATYLYYHKKDKEFLSVIRDLARMSPLAYNRLRKEESWSPSVREAVKRGIEKAADEGIDPRNAHSILSSLLAEEKDWKGAISQFQKASLYQPFFNHSAHYSHLGRLFLENGQVKEAGESFMKALSMSETRERDLEGILGIYQSKGYTEGFFQFYEKVRDRFLLSDKTDILLARALMNLKRYDEARRLLNNLNEKKPSAEAYYWLAQLASQENDVGAMELAIQKATVHDPGSSRYHLLFSQVLARRQKLGRAEQEAGLAIRSADKPAAALYVNRAQIRWANKDYSGSAEDWETAIALDPKNAGYFAGAADAYDKAGKWSMAMEYYQKAIDLNPRQPEYRKRYNAIRQGQRH